MRRDIRYIDGEQEDCPRCGHRLQSSPAAAGDVEYRHCDWCCSDYCVTPRGIERDVVRSRWGEFLEELAEHAAEVREGEAEPQRLVDWCERWAEKCHVPLHSAAISAIVVAATGVNVEV